MEKFNMFINSIYQNLSTSIQAIDDILSNTKNTKLKEEISKQSSNYLALQKECECIAKAENINLKDNQWFEKARLWTSIKMTTTFDKSTRNIAEKMMIGTIMGIISCYEDLCDYEDESEELKELSKKLCSMQEANFDSLKQYLCIKD